MRRRFGDSLYLHRFLAGLLPGRSVVCASCEEVDETWTTSVERNEACSQSCHTTCQDGVCLPLTGGGGGGDIQECTPFCSPLVMDVDGDGIHTTGADDPATFDIDADGTPDMIGWLAANDDDAFLWRDVEKNGRVDDGSELFGVGMRLPDGNFARHGFEALAVYDQREHGGDGGGLITNRDAVWRRLRLWRDQNHNGISERDEIGLIQAEQVIALGVTWVESTEVDAAGNHLRLKGVYRHRIASGSDGAARYEERALIDVFFRRH